MREFIVSILMITVLLSPSVSRCAEFELGLGLDSPVMVRSYNDWSVPTPEADLPTFMLSWFGGGADSDDRFGLVLNRKTASRASQKYTETAFGVGWHRSVAEVGLLTLRVGAGAGLSVVKKSELGATFVLSPEVDIVVNVIERFAVLFGVEGRYYFSADGNRTYPFISGEAFTIGFRFSTN